MDQLSRPDQADVIRTLGISGVARSRRWLKRALWLALLALLLVGGYAWYATQRQQARAVTYDTVPVTKGNLTVSVTATGTIQPITKVDIGSELSGVTREVRVEENDEVKPGEVLATLDVTRLNAQKARAEAQLAAARARVVTAEASYAQSSLTLNRESKLRARNLSTDQNIEQATADSQRAAAALQAARADVSAAEAELQLVQADLAKSTITSPIGGIVLKRSIEPGQTVAASLQAPVLFTIAQDIARMQLEANVDEADVGNVKVGQDATFTVDAYRDRRFPARIERMSYSPETVDGVVTYKTILSADNADLSLRPGMTTTARITVAQFSDALLVPNEALRFAPPVTAQPGSFSITQLFMPRFPRSERQKRQTAPDGKRSIYVLTDGAPQEIRVKTGASDGKLTIIEGTELKEGDEVITAARQGRANGT